MKAFCSPAKIFGLLFLVLSLSAIFVSCQKSSSEPEPPVSNEPPKLSVSVAEAAPYQYIKIQLPAGAKPASTTATLVPVNLGSTRVDAFADQPAFATNVYAYYLLVPEVPAGDLKITMAIADGKTAEGTLKITAFTKIADVAAYIKTVQDNELKEVADAMTQYDNQVLAGHMRPATRDSLKTYLQNAYNKNKAIVDALPDDEKQAYAQLVDANKSWLNAYKQVFINNPLNNYRENNQGDCEELRRQQKIYWDNGDIGNANDLRVEAEQCEAERERNRIDATKIFTGKMKAAYDAANEERRNTSGRVKAGWAFVSTFVTEAAKGFFETATGVEDVDDPFAVLQIDDTQQQKVTAQEFEVDKEYPYSAGLQLVNLSSQNAATFPVFGGIIEGINSYNTAMADLGQFLPYVPEMKVPAARAEKLYVSGYTIDQVSDSRVNVELKDGTRGKVIKITLKAPLVEEIINFTFRVNYTSNYGNGSKTIAATLVQPISKILLSATPFKITRWVEGGVDLFTMHEIWRWTCGTTEYINREQLLEATLSFASGGTCTLSEKYHEIYYDNPGTTCATVRKVDQEKSYGSTPAWSVDNATKIVTVSFTDDQGQARTLSAPAVIQNGTLTLSTSNVTLAMQKK